MATDGQERAVLAAIRCLGDAGFMVTGAATSRAAPGLSSRRCAGELVVPDVAQDPRAFVEAIGAHLKLERHDAILPGTDISVYALSEHRDRLGAHVAHGLPAHETVLGVFDKERIAREAQRFELDPPESRVCGNAEEAVAAAGPMGYPVLVKPTRSVTVSGGRLIRPSTSLVFDQASLVRAQAKLGRCIIQRRISGPVTSYAAVATDDGVLAPVVSRYARTWPAAAGSASFSGTIPAPPRLHERVAGLIEALGWRGIFELELIERPDGGLGAIDLNPRVYGSMALALAAGSPLPAVWFSKLLGLPVPSTVARPGVFYRWSDADLRNLLWQVRQGRVGSALAAARPRRGVTHPYFELTDPAPGLIRALEMVQHAYQQRGGRTARPQAAAVSDVL